DIIGKLSIIEKIDAAPTSPGQLKVHYAPQTPIKFYYEHEVESYSDLKVGAIFLNEVKNERVFETTRILTINNDLHEAASNLFSYLHELDAYGLDIILVEPIEEIGLGIAIMDRLKKAVQKYL
ncbi:MAG: Sua5 family C-terminal domain-containing protein, partial [Melioribacteraceae bacterium]|nr:Sua5 family C-terminal domain-containing protein [Melioribacteraceae bacterium]